MPNRREFIKILGMGTAAMALPNFKLFADSGDKYIPKIGLQLYTIRREIEKDFDTSVRKIAEMGYYGFETYPLPENVTLEHAAKLFKELGLEVFSMHYELPVDNKQKEEILKMAKAYDCNTLVYHGWPLDEKIKGLDPQKEITNWPTVEKYKNLEAIKRTVELYNKTADSLKAEGMRLGLHNHWWEFEKTEDGLYPFYYLLKNLNPEIFFELDVYWIKTSGRDPAQVVKDFGSRAPFLHIKDGPAVKGDNTYAHVPAGKGTLDFPAIVNAGGKNIKWMIVEFDEFDGNILKAVNESYTYLIKNKFAKGKV